MWFEQCCDHENGAGWCLEEQAVWLHYYSSDITGYDDNVNGGTQPRSNQLKSIAGFDHPSHLLEF